MQRAWNEINELPTKCNWPSAIPHTRASIHTDTQLSGRWMPDNMSSHLLRSPAPALWLSLRACLYGCTRSAWILSIDVTAVKIPTKQRMPHWKRERERDDGRVAEWESAAILRIMLYKRFALCLLPQAESVASRCARGECMYIGHWTHQWSLDTGHWTLVAWQVIKMLKYDLTCH